MVFRWFFSWLNAVQNNLNTLIVRLKLAIQQLRDDIDATTRKLIPLTAKVDSLSTVISVARRNGLPSRIWPFRPLLVRAFLPCGSLPGEGGSRGLPRLGQGFGRGFVRLRRRRRPKCPLFVLCGSVRLRDFGHGSLVGAERVSRRRFDPRLA